MTNQSTSSRGGAPDVHVRVRPAGTADAKTLATANRFVHDLHLAARPDRFKPAAWDELCEWYHAILARPATRAWLAEHRMVFERFGFVPTITRFELKLDTP